MHLARFRAASDVSNITGNKVMKVSLGLYWCRRDFGDLTAELKMGENHIRDSCTFRDLNE